VCGLPEYDILFGVLFRLAVNNQFDFRLCIFVAICYPHALLAKKSLFYICELRFLRAPDPCTRVATRRHESPQHQGLRGSHAADLVEKGIASLSGFHIYTRFMITAHICLNRLHRTRRDLKPVSISVSASHDKHDFICQCHNGRVP